MNKIGSESSFELQTAQSILPRGVPSTDDELSKAFVLKSTSEQTRRTYRKTLDDFLDFADLCNGRRIAYAEVSFEDVTKWRDFMMKEGKRPHTIATKLAILSSLFEYGRALGVFLLNPASAKLVPPPKKPTQSPGRALTAREVKNLLSWFRIGEVVGARNYAMFLIMLRISLRVSEVVNLRMSSVKWDSGRWVLVVKVKGGAEEKRPLPGDVKKAIDNYLQLDRQYRDLVKTNGPESFLFQAEPKQRYFGENTPLSTRQIWHLVSRTAKNTGLGKLSPHDLRRTAITKAFKQNIPIHHIQRMSGHRNLDTLRLYDIDRENLDDNAINELSYDFD